VNTLPGNTLLCVVTARQNEGGLNGAEWWLADVILSVHLDGRGDGMLLLKYILGKLEMKVSGSGSCPMVGTARL